MNFSLYFPLDMRLCRCNLKCRTEGHFHCPVCDTTIIRRKDMERHLAKMVCQEGTQQPSASVTASLQSTKATDESGSATLPPMDPSISAINTSVDTQAPVDHECATASSSPPIQIPAATSSSFAPSAQEGQLSKKKVNVTVSVD